MDAFTANTARHIARQIEIDRARANDKFVDRLLGAAVIVAALGILITAVLAGIASTAF